MGFFSNLIDKALSIDGLNEEQQDILDTITFIMTTDNISEESTAHVKPSIKKLIKLDDDSDLDLVMLASHGRTFNYIVNFGNMDEQGAPERIAKEFAQNVPVKATQLQLMSLIHAARQADAANKELEAETYNNMLNAFNLTQDEIVAVQR